MDTTAHNVYASPSSVVVTNEGAAVVEDDDTPIEHVRKRSLKRKDANNDAQDEDAVVHRVGSTTTIDEATEHYLPLPNNDGVNLSLWYRTWGNPNNGIPVLFVHGGPGGCVADYDNINSTFFNCETFFVVEIDQRGTGSSTPSVRSGAEHMKHYLDISIEQMSADFELVREHLNIDQWLVFGGSWGSTLSIDYATRYPSRCLGLIVRGIFLDTKDEFDAIYCRSSFLHSPRRLKEFDIFQELAVKEAQRRGEPPLHPDDSERFVRLYHDMIVRGDKDAIWRFHVFEFNLMEEDSTQLLDPYNISEKDYPEALSVSFFESTLFLRGTFDEPLDLLGRLGALSSGASSVPTWVVQGTGDEVCPDRFARQLVEGLERANVPCVSHFVGGGHKASSDGITKALVKCVDDFATKHASVVPTTAMDVDEDDIMAENESSFVTLKAHGRYVSLDDEMMQSSS